MSKSPIIAMLMVVAVATGALLGVALSRPGPVAIKREPGVPGAPGAPGGAGQARRIVALAPSLTETLFALDLGGQIVGTTEWSDYPAAALKIPRVGRLGEINVERILALSPDLVVTGDFEDDAAVEALRDRGVKVLPIHVANVAQMLDAITQMGKATGQVDKATQLVADLQSRLEAISRRYAAVLPGKRPRVFAEIWDDPVTTAGGGSFLDDVINRAGGVNVASALADANPTVSPEQVIAWNPDVILVTHQARGGKIKAQMEERLGWKDLAAVRNGRIIDDIDPDIIIRPGPRLVGGIAALADRLYGRDGKH